MLLIIALLVCSACTGAAKRTVRIEPGRSEAEILLKKISAGNRALKTFKGIGNIKLIQNKEKTTARMAFMGQYPSSLRLEVLGPASQPMYSFSAHDKTIYFFSHLDDLYYTTHKYDASLKRLISLQINVSDVIDLLSGRIPIMPYSSMLLEKNHHENGWVLILKKRWFGGSEKIYLNENRTVISKVEMFTYRDVLKYRAEIKDTMVVRNFKVPKKIIISDHEDTIFTLRIDAYDVNFKIEEEDRFIIKPQKHPFSF